MLELESRGLVMEMLIAGDLVPTECNMDLFNIADINALLGKELVPLWNSADMRIFNLEVPLTNEENPIDKCGPNLIAPTSTIVGIKSLNPSLITLANNHILDHGEQGLRSTQNVLNKNNIPCIGAGDNLYEASKPYIMEIDGIKVGIYTCAEHEFTIATDSEPGANPFDPLESLDHIQELKAICSYVIVLYHGGKEHYRYPSPYLQKVSRKMVDKGADVVICQHSHCIGCFEEYKDSTIVYGQGNFIFGGHGNEYWDTGLLVNIEILDQIKVKYIPIVRTQKGIQLASKIESEKILSDFYERSQEILQEGFIKIKYEQFAAKNIDNYLRKFSGFGRYISYADRKLLKGLLVKMKYNKNKLLAIRNYVECEAHRELLIEGLKNWEI